MYAIITLFMIISYVITLIICTYTIVHVLSYYKDYGTKFKAFLNTLVVISGGIIYTSLFLCSELIYFSEPINVILWELATIFNFITLGIALIIYVFLIESHNLQIIPFIIYSIFFGLFLGSFLSPNSVQIEINPTYIAPSFITDSSQINFAYHGYVRVILILFYLFIIGYSGYITYVVYKNARNKNDGKQFLLTILMFSIPQLLFISYIQFVFPIFRDLHFIILCLNFILVARLLIQKPEMSLILTNKVYAINIYHKSGILLYSYEFKSQNLHPETEIWGNIIIGLNHIVGEFISENNQIDDLRTKNADVIVNYNNEFGFAVLVLTNHKNIILSNMLSEFVRNFKQNYEKELSEIADLNNLIDASEFLDVENLIKEHFSIYF